MIARFNSTDYNITSFPTIQKSVRETTFSDIEIEFTGTITDLPIKYQTIEVLDNTYTYLKGFISDFTLPVFNGEQKKVLMGISIISPQTFFGKRTIQTQIDKQPLNEAVETILEPMLDDGFYIAENTLSTTRYFSEVIVNESIEIIMNRLANKYNFIWYIDENKGIYLKDIDELITAEPIETINSVPSDYLLTIQPKIEIVDYANKLNLKNIRLITYQDNFLPVGTTLEDGEIYNFTFPISIGENVARRLEEFVELSDENYLFYLNTDGGAGPDAEYTIVVNLGTGVITYSNEIGFMGEDDDDGTKKILLIRDAFLKTVITGFKWVTADEIIIDTGTFAVGTYTGSALLPYNFIYINQAEIDTNALKLGTSGVVEKVIDMNEKFYTADELDEVATGLFKRCLSQNNKATLVYRGLLEDTDFLAYINTLQIGSIIEINLPTYFLDGAFIITDTETRIENEEVFYTVQLRTNNLNENFLDIYRPLEKQEDEDKLEFNTIAFYNADEQTIMSHEVLVDGEVVNV